MAIATNKKTRQQVTSAPPAPAREALPLKTNLALHPDTVESLKWLKQRGYSFTFAIQRGVSMLRQTIENPGRGL